MFRESTPKWGLPQARKDEGNEKFEVSETDGHVFRVEERWTSKRTMFKCAALVLLSGRGQRVSGCEVLDVGT